MKPFAPFAIDRCRVVHGPIAKREGIRLKLPLPPPPHLLFDEVEGLGRAPSRRLLDWKREAWDAIKARERRFLGGPVRIAIAFPDKGGATLETYVKPILDFLVVKNFIADDAPPYLTELSLSWGQGKTCEVAIDPVEA
jgi:hypothetical protein